MERIKRFWQNIRGISPWTTILNSLQICVYLLGLVLVYWILTKIGNSIGSGNWPPPIERVADWAQVVIAYAAIFAIGQYAVAYADISDRKTKTVLDFVKFFRETVLDKSEKIILDLRKQKIQLPV